MHSLLNREEAHLIPYAHFVRSYEIIKQTL